MGKQNPGSIAEILSIGDELLIGQVVNTNQASIARRLNAAGVQVRSMRTVADTSEEIVASLASAAKSFDVVAVTGGLGPTHDDVTRSAVCSFLDVSLVFHPATMETIRRLFASRNLAVTPNNEGQAMVPKGVDVIPNALGTAPGYMFRRDRGTFFVMPGVPYEMEGMMEQFVIPAVLSMPGRSVIQHRTIKTTGIAESHLSQLLGETGDLLGNVDGLTLAYLPGPQGVRLRLTSISKDAGLAAKGIKDAERRILEKAGKHVYGFDDEELESIVGRLLVERSLTLAVAESCTGGLLSDRLTDVPGASAYIERCYVTYSDASKTAELGVSAELIQSRGAVSGEVAEAMAEGARASSGADIGLSTTGIAGPTGGSAEKPVGLVYVGYADASGPRSVRFVFGPDRRRIKERATQAALELLRRKLVSA